MRNFQTIVAGRYALNREEAVELLNDGFLRVFSRLDRFDRTKPFKPWLRTVLVRKAIDYLRAAVPHPSFLDADHLTDLPEAPPPEVFSGLVSDRALLLVQQLPPMFLLVFNLSVMEDMDHGEIAGQLGIAESTSRAAGVVAVADGACGQVVSGKSNLNLRNICVNLRYVWCRA